MRFKTDTRVRFAHIDGVIGAIGGMITALFYNLFAEEKRRLGTPSLPLRWFQGLRDEDSVEHAYSTQLAEIERFFDPDYIAQDDALLSSSSSIIVHEDNADDLDLGVGSTVRLEFVDQVEREFTVAAIYSDLAIFDSGWILPASFWDENPNLPEQQDIYITMLTAAGVSEGDARTAIEGVTDDFPQLDAFTKAVRGLPEILGAYRTSGDLDYLLHARVADVRAYDRLYQKLIRRIAVSDISASFVMEEIKETTALPV